MAKSAAERKRDQRNRDKGEVLKDVTKSVTLGLDDVTKCHENVISEVLGVTKNVTKCEHRDIEPCESRAGKHLTYSKAGPSLADRQMDVIEPKAVTCPCCGKEWLCRRPDIQDAFCLRCAPWVVVSWREREPYVRPQMETAERALTRHEHIVNALQMEKRRALAEKHLERLRTEWIRRA